MDDINTDENIFDNPNLAETNIVIKSNFFIMKSSYDLTLEEQKFVLALASMVSPDDEKFKLYEIKIADLMDLLGIENKAKYTEIPKLTKSLMSKPFEIYDKDELIQLNWLSVARYKKGTGIVRVRLDPDLTKYMLQLKERFTQYQLKNILQMRSKYSPRVYEILKSNEFKKQGYEIIELAELRRLLKAENTYPLYADFRRKVIDQAVKEINQLSDLHIDYEEIKTVRKVTSLKFIIRPKKQEISENPALPKEYQKPQRGKNEDLDLINTYFIKYGLNELIQNKKTEQIIKDLTGLVSQDGEILDKLARNLSNIQNNTTLKNTTAYFIENFDRIESFLNGDELKKIKKTEPPKAANSGYEMYVPPEVLDELRKKEDENR